MNKLADRIETFRQATIYPVVTPEFCNGRGVEEVVKAIIAGGAKIIQLRCKGTNDAEFYKYACICHAVAKEANALLIINDRIDIALAANADGVHLGQTDMPVKVARRISDDLLIGVSTHNAEEIKSAHVDGAHYLNIGPIFATQTKNVNSSVIGLAQLKKLIMEVSIPFSVMGGIKMKHLPILRQMGIAHPAMITEITQAANIRAKIKELIEIFGGGGSEWNAT